MSSGNGQWVADSDMHIFEPPKGMSRSLLIRRERRLG